MNSQAMNSQAMNSQATNSLSRPVWFGVLTALLALMTATRFHHIGSALHLPDASVAVFFLGGLWLRQHRAFGLFLVLAVLIDYVAITGRGMDFFAHYCVTPAYAFLLLAYAAAWYGGRVFAPRLSATAVSIVGALAVALVAASVSFLISNGAFYWLGGRYADPNVSEYLARAWQWVPLFVSTTMAYVAVALALYAVAARLARPTTTASRISGA